MSLQSEFVIFGDSIAKDCTVYWNVNSNTWTTNLSKATTFDREIMLAPLPPGGVGLLELSNNQTTVTIWSKRS